MSEAINKQTYELAFHISSALDEAGVQKARQDLEHSITSRGGVILYSKDPEKIRLAYPIKHQLNAFFGFFNFNLEELDSVNKIRDDLRLNHDVLRFIILKQEEEAKISKEDVIRRLAASEKRKMRAVKQAAEKVGQKEGLKLDEKQIDDKLEEIIEKL
jgi:ribosomal protein S6